MAQVIPNDLLNIERNVICILLLLEETDIC